MIENQTGIRGSLCLDCINKQSRGMAAVQGNGKAGREAGRFAGTGEVRNALEAMRLRYKNAGKHCEAKAIANAIQMLRRGAE